MPEADSKTIQTARRRPFLLAPGQSLIPSFDPVDTTEKFGAFVTLSGYPYDCLLATRMTAIPLPTEQRWRGNSEVKAAMLWHPYFWLPKEVIERKTFRIADDGEVSAGVDGPGDVYEEDALTWGIRVGVELMASGIYDDDSGTWVDVMDLVGIDIDSENGLTRVQRWLNGAVDQDLDLLATGMEMNGHIRDQEDPEWAEAWAVGVVKDFDIVSIASGTAVLLEEIVCLDEAARGDQPDVDEIRSMVGMMASVAAVSFDDLPDPDGNDATDWWADLDDDISGFTGPLPDLMSGPVVELIERLGQLHDQFAPAAQALADQHPEFGAPEYATPEAD
jgi:hypothetical protein